MSLLFNNVVIDPVFLVVGANLGISPTITNHLTRNWLFYRMLGAQPNGAVYLLDVVLVVVALCVSSGLVIYGS